MLRKVNITFFFCPENEFTLLFESTRVMIIKFLLHAVKKSGFQLSIYNLLLIQVGVVDSLLASTIQLRQSRFIAEHFFGRWRMKKKLINLFIFVLCLCDSQIFSHYLNNRLILVKCEQIMLLMTILQYTHQLFMEIFRPNDDGDHSCAKAD